MDPRQKKTTRDLTDLKSRLGLAKPGTGTQPAVGQATGPAPAINPAAPAQAAAPAAGVPGLTIGQQRPMVPPGVVIPPGGVMPPVGVPNPYAQPQMPPPDVRRDPFAAQAAQQMMPGYRPIVDAGPPIEIPAEKKTPTKLIIALLITAAIPLGVGYSCGRIYAARVLFNSGIDDAKKIQDEVAKLAKANIKVAEAVQRSQQRSPAKYDEKLVEDLKDVLRASPFATPERIKKQQDQLFRTNYAMMEGIVIDRLFNYFNNSIRLYAELELFIQKTERTKELVASYTPEGDSAQQKFGIVFASDEGSYYLGSLVEVGNIDCAKPEARDCKKEDIKGFMIRTSASGSWTSRAGKAKKVEEIVIPIIPDENWKRVATGRKGSQEHKEYLGGLGRIAAICGLLSANERPLMQDLGKAAGREKVFTF